MIYRLSADVPLTVAKCAKVLGLNSMPINTAKIFSNKLLMKKFFKKNNINTPYFKSISSLKKLGSEAASFHTKSDNVIEVDTTLYLL